MRDMRRSFDRRLPRQPPRYAELDGSTSDQDSQDLVHRDLLSRSASSSETRPARRYAPVASPPMAYIPQATYRSMQDNVEYGDNSDLYAASLRFENLERQESIRQEQSDAMLARSLQEEEDARIRAERAARIDAESSMIRDDREQLVHQLLEIYTASPSAPAPPATHFPQVPLIPDDELVRYEAPSVLGGEADGKVGTVNNFSMVSAVHSDSSEICAVCYEPLESGIAVSLRMCSHIFHLDCICEALGHQRGCPTCRTEVCCTPTGLSPSGTMFITRPAIGSAVVDRPGAINPVVIKIEYKIPPGRQAACHECPGEAYNGTRKVAYLPDTSQGNQILRRLVYAFSKGLTFRIASGSVLWASIPHLAYLGEKEDDAIRLACCAEELDNLGVPRNPSYPSA